MALILNPIQLPCATTSELILVHFTQSRLYTEAEDIVQMITITSLYSFQEPSVLPNLKSDQHTSFIYAPVYIATEGQTVIHSSFSDQGSVQLERSETWQYHFTALSRMAAHPTKRKNSGNRPAAVLTVFLAVCSLLSTHFGCTDGAQGLFVFGDSYTDTGENLYYPYGMTWPGDGTARRSSDGRNEVDFIAAKLGVPSPTPWEDLPGNGYQNNGGANFGVGGAAVTYAYGWKPLDKQVDEFEGLVKGGTWTAAHLAQSVALVSIGVNDYTYYNKQGNGVQGVSAFVDTVVGKMGDQMNRISKLGVRSIMVENLVPMSCMPFTTLWINGETGCVMNDLLDTETNLHDARLQAKVNELNKGGANIMMLDLTKALRRLFENGPAYGFSDAYKRCCTGSCGGGDGYTVCNNPQKHVIFDSIHPTEAAWKAVTNFYTYSAGYTKGATLNTWFKQNQMIT
ncbi:GDSL esterase/lipase At5g03610 [Physcomitrium patens]|uniref:Predicted protein n=1 Tax=Physcomitrium patens TaxID=3218 RepID=A9U2P2_PHYPA|nr:GDSL esterase/lipase At5g03610-like [Physcomitrium patens]|eukprot:XP_024385843.1 GDSL esterase/lipase At5g03610-like [Physcomitrella patens]